MRLPRDLSGRELARLLRARGYLETRQTGSHIRLTTQERGEHHVTVASHDALRIGTLAAILGEVATHLGVDRDKLADELFGR